MPRSLNESQYTIRAPRTARTKEASMEHDMDRLSNAIEQIAGIIVQIPGPTPAKVDQPFVVTHNLGVRPDWVAPVDAGDKGGVIYANESDKREWTDEQAVVRCTAVSDTNLAVRFTRRPSE